jgi:hypothetical protein
MLNAVQQQLANGVEQKYFCVFGQSWHSGGNIDFYIKMMFFAKPTSQPSQRFGKGGFVKNRGRQFVGERAGNSSSFVHQLSSLHQFLWAIVHTQHRQVDFYSHQYLLQTVVKQAG